MNALHRCARVAFAAAALACAGGAGSVDTAQLPDAPLALLHRPEALALDRIDALQDLEERGTIPKEGVARLENLDAMFGGAPDAQRRAQQYQGYLALLDPRTGKLTRAEAAPPGAQPSAWSPDRRRLVVAGRWRDSVQLFAWEPATGAFEILTTGPHPHPAGCLGSDGRLVAGEIAAVGGVTRGRLVSTPPGGGGLRPLTDGPADFKPACSPARPQIAFVQIDASGVPSVAVIDLERPGERRVVAAGLQPVFTSDGEWILYQSRTSAGGRIFRVRPDGTGRSPVGAGSREESQPAVSPDGRYVAYVQSDDERRERVWVRRFDGTGDRPLLTNGDGAGLAW